MRHLHAHCIDLLAALTSKGKVPAKPEWREALRQIAGTALGPLDQVGEKQAENEWMDWRISQKFRPMDADLVAKLLDVLGDLDAPALRASAADP
jgi:hypothetical protein